MNLKIMVSNITIILDSLGVQRHTAHTRITVIESRRTGNRIFTLVDVNPIKLLGYSHDIVYDIRVMAE